MKHQAFEIDVCDPPGYRVGAFFRVRHAAGPVDMLDWDELLGVLAHLLYGRRAPRDRDFRDRCVTQTLRVEPVGDTSMWTIHRDSEFIDRLTEHEALAFLARYLMPARLLNRRELWSGFRSYEQHAADPFFSREHPVALFCITGRGPYERRSNHRPQDPAVAHEMAVRQLRPHALRLGTDLFRLPPDASARRGESCGSRAEGKGAARADAAGEVVRMKPSYHADSAIKSINELRQRCEQLEAENLALKQPCGVFEEYESLLTTKRHYDLARDADWTLYETHYAADLLTAARNDERYRRNEAIVRRLKDAIEATGARSSVTVWKRNKPVQETADWVSQIRGAGPHGFVGTSALKDSHDRHVKSRNAFEAKRAAEAAAREKAQQEAERERQEAIRVVDLAKACGLDPLTATHDDLSDAIRGRDKYLDLAIAGQEVRSYWGDGCGAVEEALARFAAETEIDREIVAEWLGICADFEDGRRFRDCEWSYDKVMGLARPEVVDLWNRLKGYQ